MILKTQISSLPITAKRRMTSGKSFVCVNLEFSVMKVEVRGSSLHPLKACLKRTGILKAFGQKQMKAVTIITGVIALTTQPCKPQLMVNYSARPSLLFLFFLSVGGRDKLLLPSELKIFPPILPPSLCQLLAKRGHLSHPHIQHWN